MSKGPRESVAADGDPLPTEGLEVQEAHDEDTAQLFMREWREKVTGLPAPREVTADGTEDPPADTAPH